MGFFDHLPLCWQFLWYERHFWTTYLTRLVNVICERPITVKRVNKQTQFIEKFVDLYLQKIGETIWWIRYNVTWFQDFWALNFHESLRASIVCLFIIVLFCQNNLIGTSEQNYFRHFSDSKPEYLWRIPTNHSLQFDKTHTYKKRRIDTIHLPRTLITYKKARKSKVILEMKTSIITKMRYGFSHILKGAFHTFLKYVALLISKIT